MSNSEKPLTKDEERLTAYLDGQMTAEEMRAFEQAHPEAAQERVACEKLRASLMAGSVAPVLRNGDFFNRQILREIAPLAAPASMETERPALFSLWRLVFAGAFCLLMALGVYKFAVTPEKGAEPPAVAKGMPSFPPHMPVYFAEVISLQAGEALSTRVVQEEGLTLVMIDGLEPMEEDFILN